MQMRTLSYWNNANISEASSTSGLMSSARSLLANIKFYIPSFLTQNYAKASDTSFHKIHNVCGQKIDRYSKANGHELTQTL
jgi:hypothetical protein